MRTLDALLEEAPVLRGMTPERLELIAGCAVNRVFSAGEHLLREGERADVFYFIRHGSVAIEVFVPPSRSLVIETLHEGDLVGWSWLVPPYRNQFDVRARGVTRTLSIDGACLRGKCEEDPALGYDLLTRVAAVIVRRLQATRLRLIDVYGDVSG